jgi:hypothetical protein
MRDFIRLDVGRLPLLLHPRGKLSATTPYIQLAARHRGGANLAVCRLHNREDFSVHAIYVHPCR